MLQTLQRVLFIVGALIAIGVAVWLSVTIFAVLLVAGVLTVVFMAGRRFLVDKGILNPRPGTPMEQATSEVTIIEGEFEQIENPMVQQADDTKTDA